MAVSSFVRCPAPICWQVGVGVEPALQSQISEFGAQVERRRHGVLHAVDVDHPRLRQQRRRLVQRLAVHGRMQLVDERLRPGHGLARHIVGIVPRIEVEAFERVEGHRAFLLRVAQHVSQLTVSAEAQFAGETDDGGLTDPGDFCELADRQPRGLVKVGTHVSCDRLFRQAQGRIT